MNIQALYEQIATPEHRPDERSTFSVRPIPDFFGYLIGRDDDDRACLLVADINQSSTRVPPSIRLQNLEVQFRRPCLLRTSVGSETVENYTVIRCTAIDSETTNYFLWICETLIQIAGSQPETRTLSAAVMRLAAIFHKLHEPPTRSLNGLFGEIFIIWASTDVIRALTMWRQDVSSRFDFSGLDVRLEVKTTTGRARSHTFSYDQCNPPNGTQPIVASMLLERIGGGVMLGTLVEEITQRIPMEPNLILKLQEGLAQTLGNTLDFGLKERFDIKLSKQSLKFFQMSQIPAIRGPLEAGISDVHFASDLSSCIAPDRSTLLAGSEELHYILPPDYLG